MLSPGDLLNMALISWQSRVFVEKVSSVTYDQAMINFPFPPPFEKPSEVYRIFDGLLQLLFGNGPHSRALVNREIFEPTQVLIAATENTQVLDFVWSCHCFVYLSRISASLQGFHD